MIQEGEIEIAPLGVFDHALPIFFFEGGQWHCLCYGCGNIEAEAAP